MSAIAPPRIDHARLSWQKVTFVLWLLAVIPLFLALGAPPVQRTQEARVLETARQMLGRSPHNWLIPSLNNEIRLRKPPLAYWMAGASFSLLGVSPTAGRLPTALVSWLTLGVTFSIARRLFNTRVAILSAACLLGSYLFFRHGRLAETDAPAALFATLATDLFWQTIDTPIDVPTDAPTFALFHLAAGATGLSLFAKQGFGFFPLIFFIAFALIRRRYKTLGKFVISGAPLTLLVVAGWWYGYAAASRGIVQFRRELVEVTEGIDHPAPFYAYFPMLILAAAPWSGLMIAAFVAAARRARSNPALTGLLVWAASVFVPLCFFGNKQIHYLLPLMPCVMILVAWLIDLAASTHADAGLTKAISFFVALTIIASFALPLGLPIIGHLNRGFVIPLDFIFAGLFAAGLVRALFALRRSAYRGATVLAAVSVSALVLTLGFWGQTISTSDIRVTGAAIRRQFGSGPYVFYGGDTSLPLCFALQEKIPRIDDARPDLLLAAATKSPTLAVIWEIPQHGPGANIPPASFVPVATDFGDKGQHFRIYQKEQ
jgi:4-amino-4-deoxy-L-arabinose transferase-like glycosyltransferase